MQIFLQYSQFCIQTFIKKVWSNLNIKSSELDHQWKPVLSCAITLIDLIIYACTTLGNKHSVDMKRSKYGFTAVPTENEAQYVVLNSRCI